MGINWRKLGIAVGITLLETIALTVWLITYIHVDAIINQPVLSTVLVFLGLLPEHYIALTN